MSLPPKELLTPGPWTVNGNTIKDAQGRTIAVVFARNATAHAYWFAEIPDFADLSTRKGEIVDAAEEIEILKARVLELEDKLDAAECELASERGLVAGLEEDLAQIRTRIPHSEHI